MPKVVGYVGGLMRPSVLVWCWVEQVYVCVYEQEDSTVMAIMLDKTLNGVEVLCSLWVYPVGRCVFDFPEVCEFGLCFVSYAVWV